MDRAVARGAVDAAGRAGARRDSAAGAGGIGAGGRRAVIDLSAPDLRHSLRAQVYAVTEGRGIDITLWRRTLRRRSQKDGFTWDRITKPADDWLPAAVN